MRLCAFLSRSPASIRLMQQLLNMDLHTITAFVAAMFNLDLLQYRQAENVPTVDADIRNETSSTPVHPEPERPTASPLRGLLGRILARVMHL